jgi:DNA-directed RNA polymerase omega subunit
VNDPKVPDPKVPTYVNPDAGRVGTYAIVIGVSEYPHLAGGAAPAPETYELGQLTVSALTAYRFFERMIGGFYRYRPAPLSKCWLLLSPTPAELAFEPRLAGHVAATMENCVKAIEAWFATLQLLSASETRGSRTVFFFSGHGVESNKGRIMLLPNDYLRPPARNVNEALDAMNLWKGLDEVPRGEDLFFVDACRINPPGMSELELTPRAILNERRKPLNPGRLAPILYAASRGSAAWQPPNPKDGISCYGQALINELSRQGDPSWPKCKHYPSMHLKLLELFRSMEAQVKDLLRAGGSVDERPLALAPEITLDLFELCITEVLSPVSKAPPPPPYHFDTRAAEPDHPTPLVVEQAEIGPAGVSTRAPLSDLYQLFRSERVTDAWHGSRGFRLDQQAIPEVPFVLHRIDRARLPESNSQQRFRIVLSFATEGTHWIELTISEKRTPAFALSFPPGFAEDGDRERPPRFLVEMTRDLEGEYSVEVFLSADNTPPLKAAADIWEKYQDMKLQETLTAIEQLADEQILRESPLAALVAALVLVRMQQGARKKKWLRHLASLYPGLPDAAVFAIEQRRQEGAPPAEWSAELLGLEKRILPMTNYGLRLAADQVSEALERFKSFGETPAALERLDKRLRDGLRQLHGRGLFAVFAGREVSAGLVLPRQEQAPVATTAAIRSEKIPSGIRQRLEVDSKFRFVLLASQRAEQLMRGAKPKLAQTTQKFSPTRVAMEEIAAGLLEWNYGPAMGNSSLRTTELSGGGDLSLYDIAAEEGGLRSALES